MVHLVQTRQGVKSKKPKPYNRSHSYLNHDKPTIEEPSAQSNEMHMRVEHISKLYTYNTEQFRIHSHSANRYLIIDYHSDSNSVILAPFKLQKDSHRLIGYNEIMIRLKNHDQLVDHQILDNESIEEYKNIMKDVWKVDNQLLPSDIHCRNAAAHTIHTFKAHFLVMISGITEDFTKDLWHVLLPQTYMTHNILQQSTLKPAISAWECFNIPSSYNNALLRPPGCKVIIHKKTGTLHSWDFHWKDRWNVGVSLFHYYWAPGILN